jgi:hypothetical protein
MCGLFRDRTIQIEQHSRAGGLPTRTYQFVRSPSTKSHLSTSTALVRRPSPDIKPVKDTFQPPEGDDFDHRNNRAGQPQARLFHPLPPIIHQVQPSEHQRDNHRLFGALEGPPPHNQHRPEWSDNSTLIVSDHPERAIARLPKRDSRGRRVIRVHRSHPHHRSSSRRARTRSGGGGYYYDYGRSDGSHETWDGDSWAERESGWGTLKSEYEEWSDGGDSWDGDRREWKAIEGGRRRRRYYLN